MKDEPKEEKKPAKAEKPEPKEVKPAAKPEVKAAPKPEPARKVETKPRDVFASGRQDRTVYTHNRKSGQR